MLLVAIAAVILGLAAMAWGADRFVLGASATAYRFGLSPLLIGLVIIGFGTSAPEMLVAAFAAGQGNPALGIGNAIGSNIANIALVVGLTAMISPLASGSALLRRELPILFAVTLLAGLLMLDGQFGRIEGLLLVAALLAVTILLIRHAHRERTPHDALPAELAAQAPTQTPATAALAHLTLGLVVLVTSSYALVWGAVQIAVVLGISELIIGLTVVAIGTSLPELATGIASALRREHDLLLGNIIGSNLFNTLAVLGLPALIHPSTLDPEILTRDLPVMGLLTLALIAMMIHRPGEQAHINRIEGAILLLSFAGYLYWLFAAL